MYIWKRMEMKNLSVNWIYYYVVIRGTSFYLVWTGGTGAEVSTLPTLRGEVEREIPFIFICSVGFLSNNQSIQSQPTAPNNISTRKCNDIANCYRTMCEHERFASKTWNCKQEWAERNMYSTFKLNGLWPAARTVYYCGYWLADANTLGVTIKQLEKKVEVIDFVFTYDFNCFIVVWS